MAVAAWRRKQQRRSPPPIEAGPQEHAQDPHGGYQKREFSKRVGAEIPGDQESGKKHRDGTDQPSAEQQGEPRQVGSADGRIHPVAAGFNRCMARIHMRRALRTANADVPTSSASAEEA